MQVFLEAGKLLEGSATQTAPVGLSLQLCVDLHVAFQSVGLHEGRPTHLALEGLGPRVDHHVLLKLVLGIARLPADLAHEGARAVRVVLAVHVTLQAARLNETAVTVGADETLVVVVDADVVVEVVLAAEAHAAQLADERLVVAVVRAHVLAQVLGRLEALAAHVAGNGALGGVGGEVTFEGVGAGQRLGAVGTRVGFHLRVTQLVHAQVASDSVSGPTLLAGEGATAVVLVDVDFALTPGAQLLPTHVARVDFGLLLCACFPHPLGRDLPVFPGWVPQVSDDADLGFQTSHSTCLGGRGRGWPVLVHFPTLHFPLAWSGLLVLLPFDGGCARLRVIAHDDDDLVFKVTMVVATSILFFCVCVVGNVDTSFRWPAPDLGLWCVATGAGGQHGGSPGGHEPGPHARPSRTCTPVAGHRPRGPPCPGVPGVATWSV